MTGDLEAVGRQYSRPNLSERLLDALRAAGMDSDSLHPDDLTSFEEFHVGLRLETADLAERAGLVRGARVLDVGCGLGGPARFLARRYGCHVTGIDASSDFVAAGRMLTERVGLGDAVAIQAGDALDLAFADASFDVVWTQHVAMNIADKARLYAEMRRVLVPGGRLALHDVVGGDGSPIHFPVPWADTPAMSFLVPAGDIRALLRRSGFEEVLWNDRTAEGIAFLEAVLAAPPPPGAIGMHLYVENLPAKLANVLRNLREGRTRLLQAVCEAR